MKVDPFATVIGGFGLIFLAIKMLSASIKALTTSRVRNLIKKYTPNNFAAALWGIFLGAFTNDPNVVSTLSVSLLYSRALSQQKALIFTTWSNLGALVLLFVISLKIDSIVLYMLGITGVAVFLERPYKWRYYFSALAALLLMLLGAVLIRSQGGNVSNNPWISDNLSTIQNAYFLAYIFAILLTALQSKLVSLLLIASLTSANVLTNDQAILMVFGTFVGSSLVEIVYIISFRGYFRQFALFYFLFLIIPGLTLPFLFAFEEVTNLPLLVSLSQYATSTIWYQMLFVIVLVFFTLCVLVTIFINPICHILNKLVPPEEGESEDVPKYISSTSIADPLSALDLIDQELYYLFKRLPQNIEFKLKHNSNQNVDTVLTKKHEDFNKVIKEVYNFLKELTNQPLSKEMLERSLVVGDRIQILEALEEGTYHLTSNDINAMESEILKRFTLQTLEAQQALLETFMEALVIKDYEDFETIEKATKNIKPALDQIRQSYLEQEEHASPKIKLLLLTLTNLYERNIWLLRRLINQFLPKNLVVGE